MTLCTPGTSALRACVPAPPQPQAPHNPAAQPLSEADCTPNDLVLHTKAMRPSLTAEEAIPVLTRDVVGVAVCVDGVEEAQVELAHELGVALGRQVHRVDDHRLARWTRTHHAGQVSSGVTPPAARDDHHQGSKKPATLPLSPSLLATLGEASGAHPPWFPSESRPITHSADRQGCTCRWRTRAP
jgi:hypothetical protein